MWGSNEETYIAKRLMDTGVEERKKRARCMKRVTWKLASPYVNRQPMGICCNTQEISNGLCNNLEGWGGEGDGREFQEGRDICIPMGDSC